MKKSLLIACLSCSAFIDVCCFAVENQSSTKAYDAAKKNRYKKNDFLKEVMQERHSSGRVNKSLASRKADFLNEVADEMEKISPSSKSAGGTSGNASGKSGISAKQAGKYTPKSGEISTPKTPVNAEAKAKTETKIIKPEKTPEKAKNKIENKHENKSPEKITEKALETTIGKEKESIKNQALKTSSAASNANTPPASGRREYWIAAKRNVAPQVAPENDEAGMKSFRRRIQDSVKEKIRSTRRNFRKEIEGWYIGGGVNSSLSSAHTTNLNVGFEGNTTLENDGSHLCNALGAASGVSSYEFMGPADQRRFKASGNVTSDFISAKNKKIGLSVAGGFGQFVHGDVYAGIDACLDFVKNKQDSDEKFTTRISYNTILKQSGFTPTIAGRIGVYSDTIDSMIYGRLGCSLIRADTEIEKLGKVKMASLTPIVGLGLQKKFDHFSVRMEGDYRFITHKDCTLSRGELPVDGFSENYVNNVTVKNGVRLKSRGYALRLMSMLHL